MKHEVDLHTRTLEEALGKLLEWRYENPEKKVESFSGVFTMTGWFITLVWWERDENE